ALIRYRTAWHLDLVLRPFLLGGVIKETGFKGPLSLHPNCANYRFSTDVPQRFKFFGLRASLNEETIGLLVQGSMPAMRFLTAVREKYPHKLEDVSRQFFKRLNQETKALSDPSDVEEGAQKSSLTAEEIQTCMELMKDQSIKDKLKAATEEAFSRGAFGSPTMFTTVNGKELMFFGSDRLDQLAFVIQKEWSGPLGPQRMQAAPELPGFTA
ncbi:unnamed protein product, partial [Cyprideis torosa]